jgi:putative transposase
MGAFCVMPNHAHAIIILTDDRRGGSLLADKSPAPENRAAGKIPLLDMQTRPYTKPEKRHPLSEIVRAFKSFSAKRINATRNTSGISVWQRNYYEHIIRNAVEMENIWNYIESNPTRWADDGENPANAQP